MKWKKKKKESTPNPAVRPASGRHQSNEWKNIINQSVTSFDRKSDDHQHQ